MISLGLSAQRRTALAVGKRVRMMIVDDSVSVRNLVTRVLREEPWIDLVGTASDGAEALRRIPDLKPDVLTLDVEMPNMNGLEALKEIHKRWPSIVVIMFSTLTETGAGATIDALMHGASDYICKTPPPGCTESAQVRLHRELIPRIRQFFTPAPQGAAPAPAPAPRLVKPAPALPVAVPAMRSATRRRVIAIGVSTGGPSALGVVVPMLPANLTVPVLIVQHMPPMFTRCLAERLNTTAKVPVCEATQNVAVQAGHVYIAPGGYHMFVRGSGGREYIGLNEDPPENSCRPAVDVLFRSVNAVYGKATLAAILTGMGQDGLRGIEALKKSGASILAQDEASSVVWGMPGVVARAGLADAVVDLSALVPEILKRL